MNSITRHRVSGNYRGENAGSWEIDEWLSPERAALAVVRAMLDKKNEQVRRVTEIRLPSGRWGKRTVETHDVPA